LFFWLINVFNSKLVVYYIIPLEIRDGSIMDYEKLLERGLEKVPKKAESGSRFVVPKPEIQIAGARTIIINFLDIASALRRDPKHLLKFLLKELATKGSLEKKRLVVLGNFSSNMIQSKIDIYIKNYIKCPECNRPDTHIVKQGRFEFLKCDACGARHVIPKV